MSRPASRWTWVDLRLVPAAVTVWAGCLMAPFLPVSVLVACTCGAVVLALALTAAGQRRPQAAAAVALGILAALAVTSAAAAVRGAARESSPLRSFADSGRSVTVVLALVGDAHRLAGAGAPRVIADATVIELADGQRTHRLDARVLLFASGTEWQDLLPGQQVRVRVGVSLPDPGDDVVAVVSARGPPSSIGEASGLQRAAGSLRDGLAAAAGRVLDPRPAGLLPGLVVGDTRAMDPVLEEEFRRAGLTHLTAVSGANVAIVLTGVLWPLRRRVVDRRVQAVVAGLVLVGFVVLARPSPSVVRAAAMGAVTLLALASGRSRVAVPALSAAVCVLLLHDPGLARDAGFALSVAATAAIVLLAPGWSRRLRARGWPSPVADALAVSAAAGLATAPIVAGLSGTVSLVSLPANLLAAPAVAPATVLGLAAAVVGSVAPPLADAVVWLAGWPVRWLVLVAERAAAVPDAATGWPAGTGGAVLLTVALLLVAWALWRFAAAPATGAGRRRRTRRGGLAAAADGAGLATGGDGHRGLRRRAGRRTGAADRSRRRRARGQRARRRAGRPVPGPDGHRHPARSCCCRIWTPTTSAAWPGRSPDATSAWWRPARCRRPTTGSARCPGSSAGPGESRQFSCRVTGARIGGVAVEVLAPDPARATASAAANDLSMVARVTVRGVRILLTGDLGAGAEARLVASGIDLSADVLKVPHHGSGDADPDFLAASGARVALVSVGADNTYGHPTARLLTWLARDGMRVHRTDREGDVAVVGSARSWGVAVRGRVRRPGRARGVSRVSGPRDTMEKCRRLPWNPPRASGS